VRSSERKYGERETRMKRREEKMEVVCSGLDVENVPVREMQ
jgi:hypothetical protein